MPARSESDHHDPTGAYCPVVRMKCPGSGDPGRGKGRWCPCWMEVECEDPTSDTRFWMRGCSLAILPAMVGNASEKARGALEQSAAVKQRVERFTTAVLGGLHDLLRPFRGLTVLVGTRTEDAPAELVAGEGKIEGEGADDGDRAT